jgi:serine/threonine-protein kinase
VTHPNVCRIYDLGQDGFVRFITMELVQGETLSPRAVRRHDVSRVLVQIADALDAAHKCGVVHRDLKPSNIMVRENGQVTVMDFGLARDLSAESTHQGAIVGTPAFWAPEQARGEPATFASDVYAFGIIAAGLLAPAGANPRDPSAVPMPLRPVVARCLEPDPTRRYESGSALREALAKAIGVEPRQSRRFVALGAIALGLAIALVTVLRTPLPRAAAPAAATPAPSFIDPPPPLTSAAPMPMPMPQGAPAATTQAAPSPPMPASREAVPTPRARSVRRGTSPPPASANVAAPARPAPMPTFEAPRGVDAGVAVPVFD